jgi:hypothetical protein
MLQFVEVLLFFTLLEAAMGLLFSFRYTLNSLIGCAYPGSNDENLLFLTDILITGTACGIFCTAVLDTNVVQKVTNYYNSYRNQQKCEECPKNFCSPKSHGAYPDIGQKQQQTMKSDMRYINPLCPCHGDTNFQAKSNMKRC